VCVCQSYGMLNPFEVGDKVKTIADTIHYTGFLGSGENISIPIGTVAEVIEILRGGRYKVELEEPITTPEKSTVETITTLRSKIDKL
jgi:hypothetical protein